MKDILSKLYHNQGLRYVTYTAALGAATYYGGPQAAALVAQLLQGIFGG